MFEYYQDILCVQGGWLYKQGAIMSSHNYTALKHRKWLKVLRRGCKGTPSLVEFDSMPQRFKDSIIENHGDPHKTTNHTSFRDYLIQDLDAQKFYSDFTLPNGTALPNKNLREYVANATILNAVNKVVTNATAKRSALGGSTKQMWGKVAELIADLPKHTYPHSLPKNPIRLKQKLKEYQKDGYPTLIHKGFCNDNSEKIDPEAKVWILSRWADRVVKVATLQQLLWEYNIMAEEKSWMKLSTDQTLYNYLHKPGIKHLWYRHRYGDSAAKEKFTYQHSTKLPSMRDSLWYSDGTKLNYFYLDDNGKVATCQVYEVMDAYSEVLLGFHISKTENYEAQYSAYKMAVQVSGHRPYQIGFDGQGGHKKLKAGNFFSKLTRLAIKTAPDNGRSKTIESVFGRFQSQFLKQDWFFTGQNITAKKLESKSNREFILANLKDLPTLKEIFAVYKKRRDQWNQAPHPNSGISRLEMYRASVNDQAPKVGIWDMIDLFWIERPKPVMCSGYGITFQEKNQKYTYMVYSDDQVPNVKWLRKNIDKRFHIKYDPEDMSAIRLFEKDSLGLRFVGEARLKVEIHRGKQEQESWEDEYFQKVKELNQKARIETDKEMDSILEDHGVLPEQYGLKSPRLLGVKDKRKKAPNTIAQSQKRESNLVDITEEGTTNFSSKY